MCKKETKKVNIEIAPAVRRELDDYLDTYNKNPDRSTPKLNYTDIINDALKLFFDEKMGGNK